MFEKSKQWLLDRVAPLLKDERNRRIASGMASGVFTKGVGFLLTLVTVPMTLRCLGPERYGVWVTMISILAWISMVDLGIANGLTPALSEAFGKGQKSVAQEYVATAFWGLLGIAIIAGVIISLCWLWVDWGRIFNIADPSLQSELRVAMAIAIGIFLLNLPLTINHRIFLAYQEGLVANLWMLSSSIAGLVGIYIITKINGRLYYLIIGFSGSQLLVSLMASVWLFGKFKPYLMPFIRPDINKVRYVFSLGGLFFLNQLAFLVIFQKDTILITYFLGPSLAARFSVAWQMFLYLNIVQILVAPYLGPGFGEANAIGDMHWLRKAFRSYMLLACSLSLPAIILLVWFHRPILIAWVGPTMIPAPSTVIWLALWSVVLALQSPINTLLNNTGRLRQITIYYLLSTVANIILSLWLIPLMGVSGGIIASVVTMTLLVLLPSSRVVYLSFYENHSR